MNKNILITCLIFCAVCLAVPAQITANLDENFQWLNDTLDNLEGNMSTDRLKRLDDMLTIAERFARDSAVEHYVVQSLLEAFNSEVTAISNASDKPS